MHQIQAYHLLLAISTVVVLSYLFSIVSRLTRVPSVLLLLVLGIGITQMARQYQIELNVPHLYIEILGTVGLIMIVLESALDLEVSQAKLFLIRDSALSALTILVITAFAIAMVFQAFLHLGAYQSLVYALPFATVSSAIILPSVGHLNAHKKEFLIYEAAFSDIFGIMFFNFLAASSLISAGSLLGFASGLVGAILISVIVSGLLMFLLINHRASIRFFLMFAVLILVYVIGKMMNLPSLITILIFGLVVNNWRLFDFEIIKYNIPLQEVKPMVQLLKSITAETSFLIRTFFFVIFGMSIDLRCFYDMEALQIAAIILCAIFLVRVIYLWLTTHENLFPEVLYSPRGLISVLLFYKIPEQMISAHFKSGILVIVIVVSNLILAIGAILYKEKPHLIQHETTL